MARLSQASAENRSPAPSERSRLPSVEEAPKDVPPFFNTTYSTHRVSPLYVGTQGLDDTRLSELARRLREVLVGDVIRGVQIGLEATDTPNGQVGPLKAVQIQWFDARDVLGDEMPEESLEAARRGKTTRAGGSTGKGLWIHIRHENAAYNALLLPGMGDSANGAGRKAQSFMMQAPGDDTNFAHLPLMLLRMPQPLKNVISEWIASTFDCRVSKINLGTRTLVQIWEAWIQEMGLRSKGPDFVLTLGFHLPEDDTAPRTEDPGSDDELAAQQEPSNTSSNPGLRSLEITIAPRDLQLFVRAGESLRPQATARAPSWESDPRERRKLAGENVDDGWGWLTTDAQRAGQPFTEALARYLDHHLALNLLHPGVRVMQISCGGFVLAQGRLKVVKFAGDEISDQFSRAAWMFVTRLGQRIAGNGLSSAFDNAT